MTFTDREQPAIGDENVKPLPPLARRLALIGVVGTLVGLALAPVALAAPSPEVRDRVRQGVELGRVAAQGLLAPDEDQEKLTGLMRADAAVVAAAERRASREDKEFRGNGRALGRGHSAAVHEILAAGGSPSELPPHGQTVKVLAQAYEDVRADHPGRGQGRTKDKADGSEGDSTNSDG